MNEGLETTSDVDVSQDQEQVAEPTQEEQVTTSTVEYQQDAYWVVCEYLPKIYGCMLFIIGFCVFAFIYKVIKNNVGSHFM